MGDPGRPGLAGPAAGMPHSFLLSASAAHESDANPGLPPADFGTRSRNLHFGGWRGGNATMQRALGAGRWPGRGKEKESEGVWVELCTQRDGRYLTSTTARGKHVTPRTGISANSQVKPPIERPDRAATKPVASTRASCTEDQLPRQCAVGAACLPCELEIETRDAALETACQEAAGPPAGMVGTAWMLG